MHGLEAIAQIGERARRDRGEGVDQVTLGQGLVERMVDDRIEFITHGGALAGRTARAIARSVRAERSRGAPVMTSCQRLSTSLGTNEASMSAPEFRLASSGLPFRIINISRHHSTP